MKLFLSSMTVPPVLSPWRTIWLAEELGLDGVEIFYAGRGRREYSELVKSAHGRGLGIHFHQSFSPAEATSPSLIWEVLSLVGFLPGDDIFGSNLRFPSARINPKTPVVAYANEIDTLLMEERYWYQTVSVAKSGNFSMSFQTFCARVKGTPARVVFDTFHTIEWQIGWPGRINYFPRDRSVLLRTLIDNFEYFRKETGGVVEVHLADCSWERGRNVPLGTGDLPIEEFARYLRTSGWKGVVVPEVSPVHFLFGRRKNLEAQFSLVSSWLS